jgi:hypothetical protein
MIATNAWTKSSFSVAVHQGSGRGIKRAGVVSPGVHAELFFPWEIFERKKTNLIFSPISLW